MLQLSIIADDTLECQSFKRGFMMTLISKFQRKHEKNCRSFFKKWQAGEISFLSEAEPHVPQPRILLIDNNPKLIAHYQHLLHKLGFSVDVAKNTSEAIKIPLENYTAILIRDNLPKINAFLVLRFIKAFIPNKSSPLIFAMCSRQDCSIENLAYYFAFGIKDFIKLPTTLLALQKKLKFFNTTIQRG